MKNYDDIVTPIRKHTSTRCDGCGRTTVHIDAANPFTEVTISVGEHEDGGKTDTYDYCPACLTTRTQALAAAGSTAPLVTGVWP